MLGGDIHYLPEPLGAMLRGDPRDPAYTTQIVVVPGNGEYIEQELAESRRQYRSVAEAVPNTVFLDDDVVVLPSGLRIIGSTLWSDVPGEDIEHYSKLIADHGQDGVDNIRLGDRPLNLHDTNALHDTARSFIAESSRA